MLSWHKSISMRAARLFTQSHGHVVSTLRYLTFSVAHTMCCVCCFVCWCTLHVCVCVCVHILLKIGCDDGWKWRHFILNYIAIRFLIVHHFCAVNESLVFKSGVFSCHPQTQNNNVCVQSLFCSTFSAMICCIPLDFFLFYLLVAAVAAIFSLFSVWKTRKQQKKAAEKTKSVRTFCTFCWVKNRC